MTIRRFLKLIEQKKCVVDQRGVRMPASVVSHMPFVLVLRQLPKLQLYQSKKKRKGFGQ